MSSDRTRETRSSSRSEASVRTARRGWAYTSMVLLVAMVLAACGTDEAPAEDAGGNGTEAAAQEAESAESPEATGESVAWRYATPLPQGTSVGDGFEWFAEEVESRTDGQVSWEMFWGGSLLGSSDVVAGVRDGQADVGYLTASYSPADFPLWAIGDIPLVTSDAEASLRAFTRLYEENDLFRAEFEDQGFHVLHFFPVPPTTVGTADPVESLDDLDNLRIRSIGALGSALEAVGANAVGLGLEEVFESLDRGVLDGYTQVTFDLGVAASLHEVAPNVLHPRLGSGMSVATVINSDAWEALDAETQQVIGEAADDYVVAAVEILMGVEDRACDALLDDGTVSLSVLSDQDVDAWRDAAQDPLIEAWVERAVDAGYDEADVRGLFDQYTEYVAEYETESTYEIGVERCIDRAS